MESTLEEVHQDTFKKEYMRFKLKPGESLDDFFAHFYKILSNLCALNVSFPYAKNDK